MKRHFCAVAYFVCVPVRENAQTHTILVVRNQHVDPTADRISPAVLAFGAQPIPATFRQFQRLARYAGFDRRLDGMFLDRPLAHFAFDGRQFQHLQIQLLARRLSLSIFRRDRDLERFPSDDDVPHRG